MVGCILFTFQVSLLQKLSISLPRILTWKSNDFPSRTINRCFFQNPLFIEDCDIPNKLQPELTELQHDTILQSSCNQEAFFYVSSPASYKLGWSNQYRD